MYLVFYFDWKKSSWVRRLTLCKNLVYLYSRIFLNISEKLVSAWSFSKYLFVLLQEGIFFPAILINVNRLERSWWPRVALCLYSCSSSEWDQFLHVGVFTYFHISCRIYVFVKMYDVFNLQTLETLYLSVQYLLVLYFLALL